jgi:hypothetical protein
VYERIIADIEDKDGKKVKNPNITRPLIKELLEEVKDGKRVRDWSKFYYSVRKILRRDNGRSSFLGYIFIKTSQLIEAFWMAFKEKD